MSSLLPALEAGFSGHFGHKPGHVVKAPGRVNLIGEHTDYNDGFVLPCAVEFHILVGVSARHDDVVEVLAIDMDGESDSFSLTCPVLYNPAEQWSNYVRGVVVELQRRGYALKGCNLAVTGNIPQGAGLSSSAALEIGVIRALAEVSAVDIKPAEMAAIGQLAENNFVGCSCGIMDQLICTSGRAGYASVIDCRSLELTPLPIPPALSLLIINSRVQRGLVGSEYNLRRQQCEVAARHFGKTSLRDVCLEEFRLAAAQMDPVVAMRARHVLEENQRVLAVMEAFRQEDILRIGQLMAASHQSMKTLFEITTPEIDGLVELVKSVVGAQGGARMTGGGFGGCVVALLPEALMAETVATIAREYEKRFGMKEVIYHTRPAAGVSLLW